MSGSGSGKKQGKPHDHGDRKGHDHEGHDHGDHEGHDHGDHEGHDHGDHEGHDHDQHKGHDHGGHEGCDHDHEGHVHGHEGHHHGDHEGHDHSDDDHGSHDHEGHDHGEHEERPPGTREAESGGHACQLDLSLTLPGESDDVGRFKKLEQLLEATRGVSDVHLRRDLGHAEVCVHYDPEIVQLPQVLALVRSAGADVADRYRQQTWLVRGMDCATCGTVIEHTLVRMPGVLSASVAYASERLVVEYDRKTAKLKQIEARVAAVGYELEVPAAGHTCSMHGGGGGLAPKLELPLSISAGVLLVAGYALERLGVVALASTACYALAIATGGFFAIRGTIQSARQLRFDIEMLMVVAALAAAVLGAWFEGAFLLFLFSLGHAFEHRAMERARRSVEALGQLRPEVARVRRGAEVVEVPVKTVKRGDRILIRPGDRVPLDGTIREGESSLDQAAITGESIPVAKGPGDDVFSGTINTENALEVEVTKLSTESVLARVVDMVSQAEAQKSPTQLFAQKLERRFVPIILIAAVALPAVMLAMGATPQGALLRAVALLVAASPCALAISTPSAVLSAVAAAARGGVLIKGGAHLESLGKVQVIAFDKTGTVTVGDPKLVAVVPAAGVSKELLLGTAAGVEALSGHPLAKAVVDGAKEQGVEALHAQGAEAIHGKGMRSSVEGESVEIGNLAMFEGQALPKSITADVTKLEKAGQTTMIVKRGERFLGVVGVADTVRPEAKATLARLKELGITRTMMLSGDNQRVANAISKEVGIDEARAPLMPEGKVTALRELAKEGGVAMVGDGVNDAPALAAASVGIAVGGVRANDIALETADIVLMSADLGRLPFAVGLARAASAVIRQNLFISLGVGAVLVVASVLGIAQISQAVIFHEGSTIVVVLNALRLLRYGAKPA
ncbi:MAG: heavy metal translocating P-type ATPase [Myxococcales bacterium]|nr:heavy metal translocating P-type ATPase [Myxococcales bacterium]